MSLPLNPRLQARLRATAIHLLASAVVISICALVIFWVWYPGLYRELSGGFKLFVLIASVDLLCGPLLTLAVYDIRKPRRELFTDIGIIATLQAAALAYGVWTMALARPVHMVFEVDLFRVVTAADIEPEQLAQAPPALRALPWTGPTTIAVTKPTDPKEAYDSMMLGINGVPLAALAKYWQPYEAQRAEAARRARPLADLKLNTAAERSALDAALRSSGLSASTARWLPLVSSRGASIVLLDASGQPVAHAAIDSP